MSNHRHALLVPVQGPLELVQSDAPIDLEALLRERGEGNYFHTVLEVDTEPIGEAAFLVRQDGPENPRARAVLAHLTGVHMILTGWVAFVDLDPEQVITVLRDFA